MPFIKPLEKSETDDIAKKIYEQFEQQANNVPEWVKVMAHCPQILKNFNDLFTAIMEQGIIDKNLKWKIAYLVSDTLRCQFCIDVTAGMLSKMGASNEELTKIKSLANLSVEEQEVLSLVKDVTLDGHLDQPEIIDKLKAKMSEAELVEVVSVIGLFNYINRFNNSFAILPN